LFIIQNNRKKPRNEKIRAVYINRRSTYIFTIVSFPTEEGMIKREDGEKSFEP
jgi:hypothetical protein